MCPRGTRDHVRPGVLRPRPEQLDQRPRLRGHVGPRRVHDHPAPLAGRDSRRRSRSGHGAAHDAVPRALAADEREARPLEEGARPVVEHGLLLALRVVRVALDDATATSAECSSISAGVGSWPSLSSFSANSRVPPRAGRDDERVGHGQRPVSLVQHPVVSAATRGRVYERRASITSLGGSSREADPPGSPRAPAIEPIAAQPLPGWPFSLRPTLAPETRKAPFPGLSGEVADGTRTRDHRDHNPGLYQLSYRHRAETQDTEG